MQVFYFLLISFFGNVKYTTMMSQSLPKSKGQHQTLPKTTENFLSSFTLEGKATHAILLQCISQLGHCLTRDETYLHMEKLLGLVIQYLTLIP